MYNKSDILVIASNLFSERGYHGTTMRELASMLGLKQGSIYAHIASKEELLWEIVRRAADQFQAQAEAVPRNLTPQQQLELLVRGHLEVIAKNLPYATVLFHEEKFLREGQRKQINEWHDTYESFFQRVIEEGVRRKVFYVDDTRVATLFVLSVLNWTYHWFRPDGSVTIKRCADLYLVLIMHALKNGRYRL